MRKALILIAGLLWTCFSSAQPAPRTLVGEPALFQGQTPSLTTQQIQSSLNWVANYWTQATYGAAPHTVAGVASIYHIGRPPASSGPCQIDWFAPAQQAAGQQFNLNQSAYHFMIANEQACGSRSEAACPGNTGYITNLNSQTMAHESGHGYGLCDHARSFHDCVVPYRLDTCKVAEYGGPYSVMGGASGMLSPLEVSRLMRVQPTHDTAGGVYHLRPIELAPDIVVVDIPGAYSIYADHRKAVGLDAPLGIAEGYSLWASTFSFANVWIDTLTPAGAAWTDWDHGVTLRYDGGDQLTVLRFTPPTPTAGPSPTPVPTVPAGGPIGSSDCLHPDPYHAPCTPTPTGTIFPTVTRTPTLAPTLDYDCMHPNFWQAPCTKTPTPTVTPAGAQPSPVPPSPVPPSPGVTYVCWTVTPATVCVTVTPAAGARGVLAREAPTIPARGRGCGTGGGSTPALLLVAGLLMLGRFARR
jgi:hypothetical protein